VENKRLPDSPLAAILPKMKPQPVSGIKATWCGGRQFDIKKQVILLGRGYRRWWEFWRPRQWEVFLDIETKETLIVIRRHKGE
jgi:hypothetical protein